MKFLIVTEKCTQNEKEADGGARLVETLKRSLGSSLEIMQFGPQGNHAARWHFDYPYKLPNRFEQRVANAHFIMKQVKAVEHLFSHVIFIHISMQFALPDLPLREEVQIWTFPMFLTHSYVASGEHVPQEYFEMEMKTLILSKHIVTPSHLEKRQLKELYHIPEERIHMVPRGINSELFISKERTFHGSPKFCSIGSIKPQKNTLGLVRLFALIQARYPDAQLDVIGPVQNVEYQGQVEEEIMRLGLCPFVKMRGYIPPNQLRSAIQDAHLHLSASRCETFGRSIFETLAAGLPNIAKRKGNAAWQFLGHLPYISFVDDDHEALDRIEKMLTNLPRLSAMAFEIGELYDDHRLSQLLVSKLCNREQIAISDFDGTLYHKDEPERTLRCCDVFREFPVRIICSARSVNELLEMLHLHQLEVDWIIGYGGSVVANGKGETLWSSPLDSKDVTWLEERIPSACRIEKGGEVLQMYTSAESIPLDLSGLRIEIYQGTAYIAAWRASKLRAIHRLLKWINWSGQVLSFGDGIYDMEFLTYFDGQKQMINDKVEK